MSIVNINPETGIACGYISAKALDSDLVNDLMFGGTDETANEAYKIWKAAKADLLFDCDETIENMDAANEAAEELSYEFWDVYDSDEPLITGEKDGVKYATSWLGGALNFFIFCSPVITDKACLASPCVPNAGIIDRLDGTVTSYDVPADWRYNSDD